MSVKIKKVKTKVIVLKEVGQKLKDGDTLCLQQVIYSNDEGSNDNPCFRFIRKDSKGKMKAQRGQAAIPNLEILDSLRKRMEKESFKFNIAEEPTPYSN